MKKIKYKNGDFIKVGDVCKVSPGVVTKHPYFVWVSMESVNDELKWVARIPDIFSFVINDDMIDRLDYIGDINESNLYKLLENQNIS